MKKFLCGRPAQFDWLVATYHISQGREYRPDPDRERGGIELSGSHVSSPRPQENKSVCSLIILWFVLTFSPQKWLGRLRTTLTNSHVRPLLGIPEIQAGIIILTLGYFPGREWSSHLRLDQQNKLLNLRLQKHRSTQVEYRSLDTGLILPSGDPGGRCAAVDVSAGLCSLSLLTSVCWLLFFCSESQARREQSWQRRPVTATNACR